MCNPAVGERGAAGHVDHVLHMRGAHDALIELRHIGEHFVELHVLLRIGADEVVVLQAGDGEHGLAVELGVVKPVQEMQAAGPGSGEAHAELAGVFRVPAGHERRGLLVSHLDEADPVGALAQRFHDPVDAVPGQAENDLYVPVEQPFDEEIRSSGRCHGVAPLNACGHARCVPNRGAKG
jgi:hypothetical protein